MLYLLFCLQLAALEILVRGPRFYASHPRAIGYLVASAAAIHLFATFAKRRGARVVLALVLAALVVAQIAFFRYYHAPIDDQVMIAARRAWSDVRSMFLGVIPPIVAASIGLGALEYACLVRARPLRVARPYAAGVFAVGVLLGGPLRDGTSEVRLLHGALRAALLEAPRAATGGRPDLAPMVSRRARVPNVLFVLTESVRASDYCDDPHAPCALAPEVHRLLPDRVSLAEMRAVSSYTAISLSVLLTGRLQLGKRDEILAAPDLFDYARATRVGDLPFHIHYWSAHSGTVFERTDIPTAVDSYVSADTMMGHPIDDVEDAIQNGLDRRLADECRARIPALVSPYLAITHFSGTHAPYFFDDASAPFVPFERHVTWSGLENVHRAYQNAILEQDRSVATCVRAFVDAQRGGPWVVIFTSDHGEAFGEHKAIHHGQDLYDEQIHVPAFIAYGGGALAAEEERAIAAARTSFVTHFDLLPTVLDLLGVLDHFAISKARAEMPGQSLLRALPSPRAPLPITNCSAMWDCPVSGWAVLGDGKKLIAQPWDRTWRCMDLAGSEHESDVSGCADLLDVSRRNFPKKPNGDPND